MNYRDDGCALGTKLFPVYVKSTAVVLINFSHLYPIVRINPMRFQANSEHNIAGRKKRKQIEAGTLQ